MKPVRRSMVLLLSVLMMGGNSHSQDESPVLEGPYLGQTLPSSNPEPFAPGIISTEYFEYGGVFTPDLNEFYFIRGGEEGEEQEFVVFRNTNNRWRETIISPRVGQPFVAPDGKTIHLGRRYIERSDSGLSELQSLGSPFEDIRIMRLTASSRGTWVFDEVGSDGDGVLRYSLLTDGTREEPRELSEEINTGTWNAHPFIAPDESYIMWDGRRDDGFGDSDIYVSFRQQDGSWGAAINLGDKINTEAWEASASVTPDGKYLFFHRETAPGNVDIYWVDGQVIETLRPE